MSRIKSLLAACALFAALGAVEASAQTAPAHCVSAQGAILPVGPRGQCLYANQVRIAQIGVNNGAAAAQFGQGNSANIAQRGVGSSAIVRQNGDGNVVRVRQVGSGNAAIVTQNGSNNGLRLLQFGDGNSANIVQNGGQNQFIVQGDALEALDRPRQRERALN